jgi:hypothetical protein
MCSVVAKSDKNLMTVRNLGVCFGPTLMRPEKETAGAMTDVKFYMPVVEILIENYEKVSLFHLVFLWLVLSPLMI